MLSIQLSSSERQELQQIRRIQSDPRSEKALAALLSAEGDSVPEIAKKLKRHHHTIRSWLKGYKEFGVAGLNRKYSPGRPSTRKAQIEPFLGQLLCDSPESHGYQRNCWTIEMLRHEHEKHYEQKVSKDSIKRALKDLGYSYKKAKARPPASAPTKEEKIKKVNEAIHEIQKIITEANPENKQGCEPEDKPKIEFEIFIADESHFSTQPYLPRGWFKKRCSHDYSYTQKEGELLRFRCVTDQGWELLLEKRKKRE